MALLETKNKTLEELDVFFGGSIDSIAEKDRLRMQRINERLGIAGAETVEEVAERKFSTAHVDERRVDEKNVDL